MTELTSKRCIPCEGGTASITQQQTQQLMAKLNSDWQLHDKMIARRVTFKGFLRTMSFVNAIAWLANQENHHPDLLVGYNYCEVRYSTHAIDGLSENDFICAAKVDQLLADYN